MSGDAKRGMQKSKFYNTFYVSILQISHIKNLSLYVHIVASAGQMIRIVICSRIMQILIVHDHHICVIAVLQKTLIRHQKSVGSQSVILWIICSNVSTFFSFTYRSNARGKVALAPGTSISAFSLSLNALSITTLKRLCVLPQQNFDIEKLFQAHTLQNLQIN